jgi:hypothetical protein
MKRMRVVAAFIFMTMLLFATAAITEEITSSSTANIMILMTDSGDHLTGKDGLTLTVTASKNGGSFSAISPTITDRGNGWYNLALTAAHTDTVGELCLHLTAAGADPSDLKLNVVANIGPIVLPAIPGRVYDATATQGAEVRVIAGNTPTIPLPLGGDYTGWIAWFGCKGTLSDTAPYTITPRALSWINADTGATAVTLTAAETGSVQKHFCDATVKKDGQVLTALRFTLSALPAVIK